MDKKPNMTQCALPGSGGCCFMILLNIRTVSSVKNVSVVMEMEHKDRTLLL